MPCYHPLTAYRSVSGRFYLPGDKPGYPKGKWPITFHLSEGLADFPINIPCGQCIGCRLERSRQWAIRCTHEASLYADNCFLTLTYSDEYLPRSINLETGELESGSLASLNKRDIVLFLKRLRKKFGEGIRFFQCGEYGEKLGRPHHHVILFNFDFPDRKYFTTNHGYPLYTSALLQSLWPYGHSTLGNVTFESTAYVARYITKKISGRDDEKKVNHYLGRLPEYITMSRKPGIGREWLEKNFRDVYPGDEIILRDNFKSHPPRYYDNIFDSNYPTIMTELKLRRISKAKKCPDLSASRLAVREKIKLWKASKLIRPLENLGGTIDEITSIRSL